MDSSRIGAQQLKSLGIEVAIAHSREEIEQHIWGYRPDLVLFHGDSVGCALGVRLRSVCSRLSGLGAAPLGV